MDDSQRDELKSKFFRSLTELTDWFKVVVGQNINRFYKTGRPKEKFNVRRIWRPLDHNWVIRIAGHGYGFAFSLRSLGQFLLRALEFWVVIIATIALFRLGQIYALRQRGYIAYGGEYLLLLFPVVYYFLKSNIKLLLKSKEAVDDNEKESR